MSDANPSFLPLPDSTTIPDDDHIFKQYFTRLYEDIANNVNAKDNIYFSMAITNTAQDIPNLPPFGSFLICVSGSASGLPTLTASLCKADSTAAGSIAPLGSQAGTVAPFAAATLTISSSATNFQIRHSVAGVTGNFNIKFIGTQAQ